LKTTHLDKDRGKTLWDYSKVVTLLLMVDGASPSPILSSTYVARAHTRIVPIHNILQSLLREQDPRPIDTYDYTRVSSTLALRNKGITHKNLITAAYPFS
jgi:hypothetical protein